VKRDLTCTIADLGLCVRHIAETDQVLIHLWSNPSVLNE
jgi:hypothetical protein